MKSKRKLSRRKNTKSHKGGGLNLLEIIKSKEKKDYYVTFDGVTLQMEIYDNNIKFNYLDTPCIYLKLEGKELELNSFFSWKGINKSLCTNKETNKNIKTDLGQTSKKITDFLMELIDQFAIHLDCNKIKLIDVSLFINESCNFSGQHSSIFTSGKSFYGSYGYFKSDIDKYNKILIDIFLPFAQMNVFTLRTEKFINISKYIESPFYLDYKDGTQLDKEKNRKKYAQYIILDMEELCSELKLNDSDVSIQYLYTTLRDYCRNKNPPLQLSFNLRNHFQYFIEIFDTYFFPGEYYSIKKIEKKDAKNFMMSKLNKDKLFEMAPVIKKDLIITQINAAK